MGLSKEILLTVKDYEVKLNKDIKFYENDTIDLCFSILEYGIEVKNGMAVNKLMPINALKAYMLIETPQGVDYAESTKVEDNRVVFNLGDKYSQFVGIGKMQIVIKDNDGCRITLPEFPFEIRQSINSDWDRNITVLSTEENEIIIDEFGREIALKKISEMEEANILPINSYSMILDNNKNKKIKTNLITQKIENDLQLVNGQLESIETQKAEKDKKMYVKRENNVTRIAWKWNNEKDFWLDIAPCGVNNLPQIYRFWSYTNSSKLNGDLTKTANLDMTSGSDWVGPYTVRAVNNADGDSLSPRFTGGFHAYMGSTGTPTAVNSRYVVRYDGIVCEEGKTYNCDTVTVEVYNNICAYNTAKATALGRTVIEERIIYKITPGNIEVLLDIFPLEDIVIEKYYGIQTNNTFCNGQLNYRFTSTYSKYNWNADSDSGTKETNPNVDSFMIKSNSGARLMTAWIDNNFCLGKRENVGNDFPLIFTVGNVAKTYFNLVNGVELTLSRGVIKSFRGGYSLQPNLSGFFGATYRKEGNKNILMLNVDGAVSANVNLFDYNDVGLSATTLKTTHESLEYNNIVMPSGIFLKNNSIGARNIDILIS